MTELKTQFPEVSGEYKVVQLEMDGTQYIQADRGKSHPQILTELLEEEGGRFGLWGRLSGEPGNRPYRMRQKRFPKPEEQESMRTYETTDDLTDPGEWYSRVPALWGEGYRVLGMGNVRIDADSKTASFYGTSLSYGIGLNTKQLSLLEQLKPDWRIEK